MEQVLSRSYANAHEPCTPSAPLQEPNEREYWRRLNASRGLHNGASAKPNRPASAAIGKGMTDAAVASTQEFMVTDSSRTESKNSAADVDTPGRHILPDHSSSSSEPLFRRSGGGGGGGGIYPTGGSAAAVSYAADAIRASSFAVSHSRRLHANGRPTVASPFYDPTRPSSPAWDFGEAPDLRPGSRTGSRGNGGSRGGSRSVSARGTLPVGNTGGSSGGGIGVHPDENNGPEGTELLNYTSLGPQVPSHRATSPAFAFSKGGLDSENLSMFQADDRQEPGPGSFRPDISVTSTHAGRPCSVVMGPVGSRSGSGGGEGGSRSGSRGGMGGGGGLARPGPGQYSSWDSIGRQILSTRPSSPAMTFGTGEWELR